MPRFEESIWIDRPRQDVWDYLDDPEFATVWQTNLIEFDQEGSTEVGRRMSGVTKAAGKKVSWVSEFTQVDTGKRVTWRTVEAPIEATGGFELVDEDGGTRVTNLFDAGPLGGFFGKLSEPMVTKMATRDARSNLENLKTILES